MQETDDDAKSNFQCHLMILYLAAFSTSLLSRIAAQRLEIVKHEVECDDVLENSFVSMISADFHSTQLIPRRESDVDETESRPRSSLA